MDDSVGDPLFMDFDQFRLLPGRVVSSEDRESLEMLVRSDRCGTHPWDP